MEMSLDCEGMDTTHSETLRIWGAIGMAPHESQLRALAKLNRYHLPYTRQSTTYLHGYPDEERASGFRVCPRPVQDLTKSVMGILDTCLIVAKQRSHFRTLLNSFCDEELLVIETSRWPSIGPEFFGRLADPTPQDLILVRLR
jgi:hypothetical protein